MERLAPLTSRARDIDDPPRTLLLHDGSDLVTKEERTLQVDVDGPIPRALGHLSDRPVRPNAGVVDEDVDPAESPDDGANSLPYIHGPGGVSPNDEAVGPERCHLRGDLPGRGNVG